ncbi:MAG: hypothetical protein HYT28_01220, partial [Parcubacteria group bacterium]|nr:hypothetical protein [Parcubacteria group bacterium]
MKIKKYLLFIITLAIVFAVGYAVFDYRAQVAEASHNCNMPTYGGTYYSPFSFNFHWVAGYYCDQSGWCGGLGAGESNATVGNGTYWGNGACPWSYTVTDPPPPPPTITWYGTPNGTVLTRGEDYSADLRANQAINGIQISGNVWGDGSDHSGVITPENPLGVEDFDCSDGVCMGHVQWSGTGRNWGTSFTGLPAGSYARYMYMRNTSGSWSGAFYNTFTITPPSYTHYSVGSWSACSGYNTETGQGGTQTRTVTSYTDSNAPNDSEPASSQSCSVPTYTHYNVTSWTACSGYNSDTGQGGTQTRTVTSYTNTTSPNDSAPASSQSCDAPPDFNFLSAPPPDGESGTLGNTYSTFVTFVGGQQSALSQAVSIAVSPT